MAPKRPKASVGHARPPRPTTATPAPDATAGDGRPSAGYVAPPPAATAHAAPAPSALMQEALRKSGVSDAMIAIRNTIRGQLRGPHAAAAHAADPGKLGARNVVGTGFGVQYSNGRPTGRIGPVVFVATKADSGDVAPAFLVPPAETVGGERVPVDVIEVGVPRALQGSFQALEGKPRYGASIGRSGGQTGTYGIRARRRTDAAGKRRICAVSNTHVFVLDQYGTAAAAGPQTRIVHPGDLDAVAGNQREVGELLDFVPLHLAEGTPSAPNEVDAALAWTSPGDLVALFHQDFPFDPEPVVPFIRMPVRKEGRTSGVTEGRIDNLGVEIDINYRPLGFAPLIGTFHNQIQITGIGEPFSRGGDSGSCVLGLDDGVYHPIGLLFAGDDSTWTTLANPIQAVMAALDLDRLHFFPEEA